MKSYCVLGLGQSGLSVVEHLSRNDIACSVTDSRASPPGLTILKTKFPNVDYALDGINNAMIEKADVLVVSPGIDSRLIREQYPTKSIIGDIELFGQSAKASALISGSNGKSSVTTLVGDMLATQGMEVGVGGNLTPPALSLLDEINEAYVLELSSFQLDTTTHLQSRAATLLNISPDHLDRYDSYQDYINSKQRIYHFCDLAVFNRGDKATSPKLDIPAISFGLDVPKKNQLGIRDDYLCFGQERVVAIEELTYRAPFQIQNYLASVALGVANDVTLEAIRQACIDFKGLPHRLERLESSDGIKWINDSKGTNVGASLEAIRSFDTGKVIWILGGDAKGADIQPLVESACLFSKACILMGQAAPLFEAAMRGKLEYRLANDMQEAVAFANDYALAGDVVLLSPGCASIDQYPNFAKRGEAFCHQVQKLSKEHYNGSQRSTK